MNDAAVQVITPMDTARMRGDLRDLAPIDRQRLAMALAAEAGLAWGASPPVTLITGEGGRLVPYITKAGADMLAAIHGVSVVVVAQDRPSKHVVEATATATARDGRSNMDVGGCDYPARDAKAFDRARRIAVTRARRRAILGLVGSGFAWSEAGDRELGLEDVGDAPEA